MVNSKDVNVNAPGLSLTKGVPHRASVYRTYQESKSGKYPIARETISIGDAIFADWTGINMDPAEHGH